MGGIKLIVTHQNNVPFGNASPLDPDEMLQPHVTTRKGKKNSVPFERSLFLNAF